VITLTKLIILNVIGTAIQDTCQQIIDFCKAQLMVHDILMLWIIISLFFTLSLIFFIVILISRAYKSFIANQEDKLRKKYELLLTSYLFQEEDMLREKVVEHFQNNYFNKSFARKVMMGEVIRLHKDLSGDIKEKLKELYILMGLKEDSVLKLKSSKIYVKARGISELTQMEIKEALPEIKKYTDHKSFYLRNKVQLATVKLSDTDNFSFLDETSYIIPEWQKLYLYEMIQSLDKESLPDFSVWSRSANISVVLFSLRMLKYFNQTEACSYMWTLLTHKSAEVRIEVIRMYADLQYFDEIEMLKYMYPTEKKEVQLEIINTLRVLGNEEVGLYLKSQFTIHNDYDINLALSYACYYLLDNNAFGNEEDLNLPYDLQPYTLHVTDPLI
jgi:hypothetical protein